MEIRGDSELIKSKRKHTLKPNRGHWEASTYNEYIEHVKLNASKAGATKGAVAFKSLIVNRNEKGRAENTRMHLR